MEEDEESESEFPDPDDALDGVALEEAEATEPAEPAPSRLRPSASSGRGNPGMSVDNGAATDDGEDLRAEDLNKKVWVSLDVEEGDRQAVSKRLARLQQLKIQMTQTRRALEETTLLV